MKWLIDGHNLIGRLPGVNLSDPHDEEKLIEYLRRFRAQTGHTLTVVFDPGPDYGTAEKKRRGGITIQFASRGRSADQIIMRQLRRVKNPQEVMVVSSDREIQQAARQAQVRLLSSEQFAQQLLSSPSRKGEEEGTHADVKLSEEEVEDWLALFNQSNE